MRTQNDDILNSLFVFVKDTNTDELLRVAITSDVQIGILQKPKELTLTGKFSLSTIEFTANESLSTFNVPEHCTIICVSNSGIPLGGSINIILPSIPRDGQLVVVKDVSGSGALYNINISSTIGTIDASSTLQITENYGSVILFWFNSQWHKLMTSGGGGGGGSITGDIFLTGSLYTSGNVYTQLISSSYITSQQIVSEQLSGSLQTLADGTSYLVAGNNIQIVTQSNGQIEITATDASDKDASYLVLNATASLNNERYIQVGAGLTYTDLGPGNAYNIRFDDTPLASRSINTYMGVTSGSHQFSATTWTNIDNVCYINSEISNGISYTTGSLTVSQDGEYIFFSKFNAYGNSQYFGLRLRRQADTLLQNVSWVGVPGEPNAVLSGIVTLNSGDIVDLQYAVQGGTAYTWDVATLDGETMQTGMISMYLLTERREYLTIFGKVIDGAWTVGTDQQKTTGSISIDGQNRFAEDIQTDVYFYVSGTVGDVSDPKRALFGGDVIVSGTLTVENGIRFGTGSYTDYWTPEVLNVGDWEYISDVPFAATNVIRIADKLYAYGGVLSGSTAGIGDVNGTNTNQIAYTNKIWSASYSENPVWSFAGTFPSSNDGSSGDGRGPYRTLILGNKIYLFQGYFKYMIYTASVYTPLSVSIHPYTSTIQTAHKQTAVDVMALNNMLIFPSDASKWTFVYSTIVGDEITTPFTSSSVGPITPDITELTNGYSWYSSKTNQFATIAATDTDVIVFNATNGNVWSGNYTNVTTSSFNIYTNFFENTGRDKFSTMMRSGFNQYPGLQYFDGNKLYTFSYSYDGSKNMMGLLYTKKNEELKNWTSVFGLSPLIFKTNPEYSTFSFQSFGFQNVFDCSWVGPDGRLYVITWPSYPQGGVQSAPKMYRSGRRKIRIPLNDINIQKIQTGNYETLEGYYVDTNEYATYGKTQQVGFSHWRYHRSGTI